MSKYKSNNILSSIKYIYIYNDNRLEKTILIINKNLQLLKKTFMQEILIQNSNDISPLKMLRLCFQNLNTKTKYLHPIHIIQF